MDNLVVRVIDIPLGLVDLNAADRRNGKLGCGYDPNESAVVYAHSPRQRLAPSKCTLDRPPSRLANANAM